MKADWELVATPFDSLASVYDAWFEEEGKLIFAIEVEAFQKVMPSLPKPWLEIGVGSGRFAQALGIEFGLDPSVELVDMARSRGINAIVAAGERIPFGGESFETVFLIVTLCFVNSPLRVLREANRILQKDGKIVLGLVLRGSPWGQFYQMKKEAKHHFYKYATFYNYTEVMALLRQAGFSLEKTFSTLHQRPGEVERMESPRVGFSPDAGFTIILASKSPHEAEETKGINL